MSAIEITQDYECDEDGEIGGPLSVFWADGHGYDPEEFIRAVIDHTLEMRGNVPRIDEDDAPVERWQWNRLVEDGVIYERADTPPPEGAPKGRWFPITVLNLDSRRHGATKCSIHGCGKPWSCGPSVRVVIEPDDGDAAPGSRYMAMEMWLCREHMRRFPEPSYRVCLVPVGATIVLDQAAS